MDIMTLLQGRNDCPCGKVHTCNIKHVYIENNASLRLPALAEDKTNILVVADENTFAAGAAPVLEALSDKHVTTFVFPASEGNEPYLVPNEANVEKLMNAARDAKAELIVGVGSGVINDLCKYSGYKSETPYIIYATAPSMDGYASKGAAMLFGGMKVTPTAKEPFAILGDPRILAAAPLNMIRAGYGDIVGKFSCLNDWKLSAFINGEYFCQYVYDLTMNMAKETADNAEKIMSRDENAIGELMKALVAVGIGMAFLGTSRSASGSEHHMSHFFEITGLLQQKPYLLHGIDVGYASCITAGIRDELLSLPAFPDRKKPPMPENQIRKLYGNIAGSVIALQKRVGFYDSDRTQIMRDKWPEIMDILAEAPRYSKMVKIMEAAGYKMDDFRRFYTNDKIGDAILYAKDLKDRYTVLWLFYEACC